MAKVVKGVVSVIGAVASVLAVIPSPIQPIAAVVATVASVASTALNMIAPTKPKSSAQGQQTSFKLDPQSGIPYVIGRTLTGGNGVHRDTWGTDNQYQGFAIVWSGGGPVQAIEAFQADQTTIGFGAGYNAVGGFKDFMWLSTQLGACPSPALPTPVAGFPGWGAQSKLSGYAAGVWVTKFDKKGKKYSGGLPRPAAIIQGVKVYDPRQDSTYPGGVGPCRPLQENTYVYSENPWLHALTWALGRWQNGVKVMGVGMLLEQIAVASFVDAANIADANNWKAGGVVSSVDDKWEVMKMLAQAGGGQCIRLGARLTALVEAPRVAVATIRESDLVGKASISATQFQRSRINRLVPIYRSEAHGWEQVPADPVSFAVHEAEDGGRRTAETEFVLVQQIKQAAELAGYEIKNSREFGPIDLELKIQWLGIEPGDLVNLDMPSAGLANQPALALTRGIDPGTGNVALSLRSETPTKHAEALGKTTTIAPSPSLVPPDLSIVAAPTVGSWTLAAGIVEGPDGTGLPILVARGATDNPNASHVVFEYRPVVAPQGVMPPAPAIGDIAADSTGAEFVYEAGGWARRWLMQSTQDAGVTLQEFGVVTPQTSYQIAVSYVSRGVLGDRRVLGPVLTGSLVASGFAGAGDLAGVDYVRFGDGTIRTGGGGTATDAGYQTALGTAAAIAGQGPGATAGANDVLNNRLEGGLAVIPRPVGGSAYFTGTSVAGAIKIRLPNSWTNSFLRFAIDIYSYENGSVHSYVVGGHDWAGTPAWVNPFALFEGPDAQVKPVRFGHDGTGTCVWIGNPSSSWLYLSVRVRDLAVGGHGAVIGMWDDGWQISMDLAAATNVSGTIARPRFGDSVYGEGILEAQGGAVATLPNFRTNLGTAAAIAGQGPGATALEHQVMNGYSQGGVYRINNPSGGARYEQGQVFGAIRIRLPLATGVGDAMIRFRVEIYEYVTGRTVTYEISGYTYNAGGLIWLNHSARAIGGSDAVRAVRFGVSGGRWAVWIGDPGDSLSYPAVNVTAVQVSYGLASSAFWESGWEIGFDTGSSTDVSQVVANPTAGDAVFGVNMLEAWNGSAATLPNFKTALGTAGAIAGQGPGATASGNDVLNNRLEGSQVTIPRPVGGGAYFGGFPVGAIKIRLPNSWTTSFLRMAIDVYSYDTGSVHTYMVGGHDDAGGQSWYQTFAVFNGSQSQARPVRFGHDGTRAAIWIGETNAAWAYLSVRVRDLAVGGHGAVIGMWDDGWQIDIDPNPPATVHAIVAKPRPGDSIFGEGIFETGGGAVATLPNFRTNLGTAAAIAGQADWATYSGISTSNMAGRVSRLDSGAGRALDGRLLNSNNNFGLRALSAPPGMSATAQTSTATVDFNSSGILYPDWGGTLSLPSASFPGLSQSTQYYFWRNMPSPDGIGSSYGYSTNLVDALGTGKVYLGQYFTPAAGGGGGGGGGWGGENCVAADAIVRLADGRLVDAAEVKAGDRITVLSSSFDGIAEHVVSANLVAAADCVRLVTESMIPLTLALNTPMTTKDRGWIIAANASGYEIPVLDAAGFRWEKVLDVEYVGRRPVARIDCENGTYAAGDIGGRFILSHNPIYKP